MLCRHRGVVQKSSSESGLNRDKPSGCSFPRPMGSLGPKAMITGGAGYCGFYLCYGLIKEGFSVVLLDVRKPTWEIPEGAVFFQVDVEDYEKVFKASEGIDTMFHLASRGMFGVEQLEQKEKVESTNVGGTKVIIDVCKSRNISKLIYTSTVNVVFGGNPIEDGDESLPYFPLEQSDSYSRTKSIAEQMVLAANGDPLQGGETLRTCALRLPGIYGPGQQRHFPHIFKNIQRCLTCYISETKNTWINWIHICNLTQAHLLASKALTAERNFIASGQAYFVHDGEDVNVFEWIAILYEKLGYPKPRMCVPGFLLKIAVILMENLHWLLKPIFSFTPLLTRTEVKHLVATHTFRIDKARNQLGYHPKKYSLTEMVDYHLQKRPEEEGLPCP